MGTTTRESSVKSARPGLGVLLGALGGFALVLALFSSGQVALDLSIVLGVPLLLGLLGLFLLGGKPQLARTHLGSFIVLGLLGVGTVVGLPSTLEPTGIDQECELTVRSNGLVVVAENSSAINPLVVSEGDTLVWQSDTFATADPTARATASIGVLGLTINVWSGDLSTLELLEGSSVVADELFDEVSQTIGFTPSGAVRTNFDLSETGVDCQGSLYVGMRSESFASSPVFVIFAVTAGGLILGLIFAFIVKRRRNRVKQADENYTAQVLGEEGENSSKGSTVPGTPLTIKRHSSDQDDDTNDDEGKR